MKDTSEEYPWQAFVQHKKVKHYLGCWGTEAGAGRAYDQALICCRVRPCFPQSAAPTLLATRCMSASWCQLPFLPGMSLVKSLGQRRQAEIQQKKVKHYLGCWGTEADAGRAYNQACICCRV